MKTVSLSLVFALLLAGCRSAPSVPIDVAPPKPQATFMLPDNYVYRQDNPIWASDRIGETDDRLSAYGCTVSGVAMAVSNLTGAPVTPQALNRQLSDAGGFTDRGWLIWNKVSEVTDGKVTAEYFDTPRHENIRSCMDEGGYPLLKIYLPGHIVHWVTVVGNTQEQYLIRDPLSGGPNDPPIELSERSSQILGVRCVSLVLHD